MVEQLTNILNMITDVEWGNWPAKVAILEIKKVAAALAEQARAAEQGQMQFTDDRAQTSSDELLMECVENHLSVMGAFPKPPCNCRLHRALLASEQPEQGQETLKRSLHEVLEELCPGVRKRNWPAWAGPYTETGTEPPVAPMMTQDEDDVAPTQPPAAEQKICRHGKREDEPCTEGYCFRAEHPTQPPADSLWRAARWNRITWECREDFLAWRPTADNQGIEVLAYNYGTLQFPSGSGLFSIVAAPSLEAIGGKPTQPPANVVERIVQRFAEMEGEDDLTEHAKVAIEIAREGYIHRGEMTEYKPIYGEIIKRLEGAHIVAGLPGSFEWSSTIEKFVSVVNAQKHLAKLASDRYDKILELERQIADTPPASIAREGYVSLEERDAQWEKAIRIEATRVLYGPKAAETFITSVRNRIAKPAERERERVHIQQSGSGDYLIILDGNFCFRFDRKQDAELYAAGLREELRDGKEGK